MNPPSSEPPTLRVLLLDADLVAVDKPPGLLVHPTRLDAHETDHAWGRLQRQLGMALWGVHRLDKGTSGVLLFARSAEAARALNAALETGQAAKRYLALVRGWPAAEGRIDHALARDPERPSAGQDLLPASTRWQLLQRHEWPFAEGRHASCRTALVMAMPLSGRRHQIRRHFKRIGHPLVGDSTHGKGPLNRAVASWLGVQRLWLHAWRLDLPAFDGRPARTLVAPPGAEWQPVLAGASPAVVECLPGPEPAARSTP